MDSLAALVPSLRLQITSLELLWGVYNFLQTILFLLFCTLFLRYHIDHHTKSVSKKVSHLHQRIDSLEKFERDMTEHMEHIKRINAILLSTLDDLLHWRSDRDEQLGRQANAFDNENENSEDGARRLHGSLTESTIYLHSRHRILDAIEKEEFNGTSHVILANANKSAPDTQSGVEYRPLLSNYWRPGEKKLTSIGRAFPNSHEEA